MIETNFRIGKTQKKIFAISAGEAEALAKIFSSTLADTLVCNIVGNFVGIPTFFPLIC